MSLETQQLFDISAAAAYLKQIGATSVTTSFIRGLIASEQVPKIRIGKKFFVTKNAIDSWLRKSERRAGA
jgi:hypothetical protein